MSNWSHLPNAEHIDRILAHLEAHPKKWTVIRSAAYNVARDAVRYAAYDAARTAARIVARNAALKAARDVTPWHVTAYSAASGAILALIANDTCAYLLREKIEHVELLAGLGIDEAILLLPAVRAMSHE
jgi:hypothetical protein